MSLARLLDQRLGDGRVRVAERADGDAAAQIQVAPPGHVVEVAARAVAEHEVEAAVAGHDVLLEQRLHGGHVVAHDRRR